MEVPKVGCRSAAGLLVQSENMKVSGVLVLLPTDLLMPRSPWCRTWPGFQPVVTEKIGIQKVLPMMLQMAGLPWCRAILRVGIVVLMPVIVFIVLIVRISCVYSWAAQHAVWVLQFP